MAPTEQVLVFDLNGTLLDLGVLDAPFEQLFGRTSARQEWFGLLETLWMTDLLTNAYHPFEDLAQAALRMLVERWGVHKPVVEQEAAEASVVGKLVHAAADALDVYVPTHEESAIMDGLKALPPFPDVRAGLARLRQAGYQMAALTNGTLSAAETLLRRADLSDFFETVLSVDSVKRFKPAPEAYAYAANQLQVAIGNVCLVAAHPWDIAGAKAAGCQTVFVRRPGQVLNPEGPTPDRQVASLLDLLP